MGKKQKILIRVCNTAKVFFEGEVDCLLLPSKRGSEMAIFPYHTPLIGLLSKGKISIVEDGHRRELCDCQKGVVRVDDNTAAVMVDL